MMTSVNTFDSGYIRYAHYGGCGNNSIVVSYTMPAYFWDNIWISENSVIMETKTERNGDITRRFNLKSRTPGDRLAFAVPGHLGVTA